MRMVSSQKYKITALVFGHVFPSACWARSASFVTQKQACKSSEDAVHPGKLCSKHVWAQYTLKNKLLENTLFKTALSKKTVLGNILLENIL